MRKIIWKIIVLITVLIMTGPSAFSESLFGTASLTNNVTTTYSDGEKTSSSNAFRRNFSLGFNKTVTPLLSYSLNLRTDLSDLNTKNFLTGQSTDTYGRNLEPVLDISLRNNMYNLNAGYRRKEQWDTAHYSNAGRETSDFYYSRLSFLPERLPSLLLDFERLKVYDHLPERESDTTSNSYRANTSYILPSRDLQFRINANLSRDEIMTPLTSVEKTINDGFNTNYEAGYRGFLWGRKLSYIIGYQGNYSRNSSEVFVKETGTTVNQRRSNRGLDALDPDVQVALAENADLIDGDLTTSAGIDLSNDTDNHIGVQILFGESVDRLYVYVDEDLASEANLDNPINWRVFKSDVNLDGQWTEVDIDTVTAVAYDFLNTRYRLEIKFEEPQEAFYFKAINLSVSNLADVEATEIEAHGTDVVGNTGVTKSVSSAFSQGLNFRAGFRPYRKWDFGLRYSLDRSDRNPISVSDSVVGLFDNIFNKTIDHENENFRSNTSRTYSALVKWLTHSMLTTTLNVSRNEDFDSIETRDSSSNAYNLSFYYTPLPEISARLSAVRSENYSFDEKQSLNNSFLITADTELYRDVHMTTDVGYSQSESFVNDTETSTTTINGFLDALITRKMSGSLNFGLDRTTTDDRSSSSENLSTLLTYRLGRLLSVTGDFSYAESEGKESIAERVNVDWLPLPRLRLNLNYSHSVSDGSDSKLKTDSASGFGTIYLTRYASLRVTYAYARSDEGTAETETHIINTSLNCRF